MTSFQHALELARNGRAIEAETLLRDAVTGSRDGSPERTHALFDLSNLLVACGDLRRAVEPLRSAVAMRSTSREHEQARLTGTMNLGEILGRIGEHDDALRVLRAGLDGRREFYGEDHAGYAYGLESLAKIEHAHGELQAALGHINSAVGIFWQTGNERVAAAFATRAPIVKAAGGLAFNQLSEMPDELFDTMVGSVLGADDTEPPLQLEVLVELADLAADRPNADGWLPQIYAAISNVARDARAQEIRIEALDWLREHMDATGDPAQALGIVLAMALAQDESGNVADAEAHYKDAETRATKLGDARARARVGRNHALFLSQRERPAEARPRFDAALADARRSGDAEELGRCATALGIFLQHLGEQRAEPLLDEAVRVLPADNADALCARSHLMAIRGGGSCGCGEMTEVLSSALLDMIRSAVPGDLVATVDIKVADDEPPDIAVQLAREPTPSELRALDSAVHLAVAQLQQNLRRRGLTPAK